MDGSILSPFGTVLSGRKCFVVVASGPAPGPGLPGALNLPGALKGCQIPLVEQATAGYDGNIAQLEEQLRSKSDDDQNDVVPLLEEQEIRQRLAGLDPLEVVVLYQEASRTGNQRLVTAVENAPAPFNLVQPEVIDEARQERAERANPEVAQRIADLRLARDSVNDLVQAGRGELQKHGLPPSDSVAEISESEATEQVN